MDRKIEKRMLIFSFICAFIYATSYITRKSFNASVLAIVEAYGIEKARTGIVVTTSFITYGIGQIINGVIGDRIKPKYMITTGLLGASACNIFASYISNMTVMAVVWGFNGFFQAMLWPPLVRSMTENLTNDYYKKGSLLVSTFACFSTGIVYAIVSLCVKFFDWKYTFYFATAIGIVMALVWYFLCNHYEKEPILTRDDHGDMPTEKEEISPVAKLSFMKVLLISGTFMSVVALAFQGFLRDGIETWMSDFIKQTYNIETSGAILSVAIIPVISTVFYKVCDKIEIYTKNTLTSAGITYIACVIASGILVLFYKYSPIIGIVAIATICGGAHGINFLLTTRCSPYFRKSGHVSAVSGILNSATYIGAAIATYGIANITDKYSWSVILVIFFGVSLLGGICCFANAKTWKKFTESV